MKANAHRSDSFAELERGSLGEVRAVYAELEQRPIERSCVRRGECCHFKLTGRTPYLTKGEALAVAKGLRGTGRTRLPQRADGACPVLDAGTGRCLVYEARPFGCRTHFCAGAGGPYSRREVLDLIRRLEEVDTKLGGDGARPFASAVQATLTSL